MEDRFMSISFGENGDYQQDPRTTMTEENESGSDTRLQTVISFFFRAFLLLFQLVLAISRVFSSFLRVLYVSMCH